jgi:hypothetical protein
MRVPTWKTQLGFNHEIHEPHENQGFTEAEPISNLHPPSPVASLPNHFLFRVFGVFRGFNCGIRPQSASLAVWRPQSFFLKKLVA